MGHATLVNFDVLTTSSQILKILDDAGLKISVALWMITPEFDDGRLVISSAILDQSGLLDAYETVALALQHRFVHELPPLLILRMKDPLIKELRRLFSKASSVEGMRLGGQTIGNRYIEQAYVFGIR